MKAKAMQANDKYHLLNFNEGNGYSLITSLIINTINNIEKIEIIYLIKIYYKS